MLTLGESPCVVVLSDVQIRQARPISKRRQPALDGVRQHHSPGEPMLPELRHTLVERSQVRGVAGQCLPRVGAHSRLRRNGRLLVAGVVLYVHPLILPLLGDVRLDVDELWGILLSARSEMAAADCPRV